MPPRNCVTIYQCIIHYNYIRGQTSVYINNLIILYTQHRPTCRGVPSAVCIQKWVSVKTSTEKMTRKLSGCGCGDYGDTNKYPSTYTSKIQYCSKWLKFLLYTIKTYDLFLINAGDKYLLPNLYRDCRSTGPYL